jgi:glyoxylase-like metal-dependent hydrolase (beta-lactamase superfamily II)
MTPPARPPYDRGLVEVADGVHAYLQPDGTWGWSNAGLVVAEGGSLLVDTLFDLDLTAAMLDEMAPLVRSGPIGTVVNTHANGDHCYGNQLVDGPGVRFVASEAAAREMDEVPPALLAAAMEAFPDGEMGEWLHHAFGPFAFGGIEVPPVTDVFTGRLGLDVGGRRVELYEVGPAHTGGDVMVHLPDDGVLFTGDILFIGGTPIMWAGPSSRWIAACDLIAELAPAVIVPGHGPLTDVAGAAAVGEYLRFVRGQVAACLEAGGTAEEAAVEIDREIDGTRFASWSDRERLAVTVHAVWRELDPGHAPPDVLGMLAAMAGAWARRR